MRRPPLHVLYPHGNWHEPSLFWDHLEREIDSMPRPYAAIAIRTNPPGSSPETNTRRVLEALLTHPVATRLRFVDPLDVAPSLLSRRARSGLSWAG
jgi:hypothetical protein